MPAVIKSGDLPRLRSTRDGRERIDLVTKDFFGWTDIQADFIATGLEMLPPLITTSVRDTYGL